ncbi:hypothetical protein D3C72_2453750 [compost metagenome]
MPGSMLESGLIKAPANVPRPAPRLKVMNRMRPAWIPRPLANSSFMITARVLTPKRVPLSSAVSKAHKPSAKGINSNR